MPESTAKFKKFVLTKEYLTGVDLIDRQHRNFIDIANEILTLANKPPGKGTTLDAKMALDKLGNYALYHFGTEEECFQGCSFADAAAHIALHDAFRRVIGDRLQHVHAITDATTSPIGDELRIQVKDGAVFAATWLLNHIMVIDKKDFGGMHDCIEALNLN